MDLARFIWELLGVLILNSLRQWCLKRMLFWIVVRQKQLESRAVPILVDAVKQGFSDSRVEVDSLDRPWFRFANGHWGRGSLKSLVADSYGMDQHSHFGSRKRASSSRHEFA